MSSFKIKEILGTGATCHVYSVDYNNTLYALKTTSSYIEVDIMNRFRHPYICSCRRFSLQNKSNEIDLFMPLAECDMFDLMESYREHLSEDDISSNSL